MIIQDLGKLSYSEALNIQKEVHENVANGAEDHLLLVEHPHVYTFGKSADHNNLLINKDFLEQINAEVFQTDRGGDITYHGPGQLVGYPIIDLNRNELGVRRYVELLENALIRSLAHFNIRAYQIDKLVGIWVGEESEIKRKIGAIGIKVSKSVSMHGFALNVNTDLTYFDHIVPCGITDKTVTSILKETGSDHWDEFKNEFVNNFQTALKQVV